MSMYFFLLLSVISCPSSRRRLYAGASQEGEDDNLRVADKAEALSYDTRRDSMVVDVKAVILCHESFRVCFFASKDDVFVSELLFPAALVHINLSLVWSHGSGSTLFSELLDLGWCKALCFCPMMWFLSAAQAVVATCLWCIVRPFLPCVVTIMSHRGRGPGSSSPFNFSMRTAGLPKRRRVVVAVLLSEVFKLVSGLGIRGPRSLGMDGMESKWTGRSWNNCAALTGCNSWGLVEEVGELLRLPREWSDWVVNTTCVGTFLSSNWRCPVLALFLSHDSAAPLGTRSTDDNGARFIFMFSWWKRYLCSRGVSRLGWCCLDELPDPATGGGLWDLTTCRRVRSLCRWSCSEWSTVLVRWIRLSSSKRLLNLALLLWVCCLISSSDEMDGLDLALPSMTA